MNLVNIIILSVTGLLCALHVSFTTSVLIIYPSDLGGTNWSGILSVIELVIALTVGLVIGTNAYKISDGGMNVSTFLFGMALLGNAIVTMYRMSETGLLFDGFCKSDICPTTVYRTKFEINEKPDCKFNTYFDSPTMWKTNTIDWFDKSNYKTDANLFDKYPGTFYTEDNFPTYEACWYWGCDPVCNDRHDINRLSAIFSLIMSIVYLILTACTRFIRTDYTIVSAEPESEPEPVAPVEEKLENTRLRL